MAVTAHIPCRLILALMLCVVAHGHADPRPWHPFSTLAQPELSDTEITRPAVGLHTTLPVGATRTSYVIAGRGTDRITLPGIAALVNLSDRQIAVPKTLKQVADSIIRDHLSAVSSLGVDPDGPGENTLNLQTARGRLLSRETREINGWAAEVLYLQIASVGGEDSAYGYAVFMPTDTTVALFALQTTISDLAKAKPYFELMVDSTRIVDPTDAAARRAMGVEAGIAFFQSLTADDFEAVLAQLGKDWRYERFSKPAATGDESDATELGYRRTRFLLGTRGDLKTGADRGSSGPGDRQKGYLVFQEARILHDEQIIDVAAGYFVSPDRSLESWTIRQSIKGSSPGSSSLRDDLREQSVVVETGVRNRADLTISRRSGGSPVKTIHPAIEGAGYISRAEVLLLPYLLMHKGGAGDHRFYAFNQAADRVTLRVDMLEAPTPERPTWVHTSSPSEGSPGQTATYSGRMELVKAERGDGQVWEPITLRRLYDLWTEKGLPLQ